MSSTNSSSLSSASLNRIDDACQQFEASWCNGKDPKLEDFLSACSDNERTPIFIELVHLELEYRSRRGEEPELQTYLDRFPKYGNVVQEIFAHHFGGSTSRIGDIHSFGKDKLPVLKGYEIE